MDVCGRWFESCSDHYSFMGMRRALSQNMWNLSGGGGRRVIVQTKKISGWWRQWRSSEFSEILEIDFLELISESEFECYFPQSDISHSLSQVQDIRIGTNFLRSSLVKSSFSQDKFSVPLPDKSAYRSTQTMLGEKEQVTSLQFLLGGGMYL